MYVSTATVNSALELKQIWSVLGSMLELEDLLLFIVTSTTAVTTIAITMAAKVTMIRILEGSRLASSSESSNSP